MILSKKVLNALSQVTGIKQEDIKKDVKNEAHKDMFELSDWIQPKIKKFISKDDYKGLKEFFECSLGLFFFYIPSELKGLLIAKALKRTLSSEKRYKQVMKIIENESIKNN